MTKRRSLMLGRTCWLALGSAWQLTACSQDVFLETTPQPLPAGSVRVVPTDERPVVQAEAPPPPLSGGTLLFSTDGQTAFAADAERDRISVVDVRTATLTRTIALSAGDQPGRVIQDPSGRVHVVLRGAGELLSFAPDAPDALLRRTVCPEPRGLAYFAPLDQLLVACRGGQLMGLGPDTGDALQLARLDTDLRDVVTTTVTAPDGTLEERLHVTRFRSAEVLDLADDFSVESRLTPPRTTGFRFVATTVPCQGCSSNAPLVTSITTEPVTLSPEVAWKTATRRGDMIIIHQRAQDDEVDIDTDSDTDLLENPYGGGAAQGDQCGSIVGSTATLVKGSQVVSFVIPGALPLDVSLSDSGSHYAVAYAGQLDPDAPQVRFESNDFVGAGNAGDVAPTVGVAVAPTAVLAGHEPVVAVYATGEDQGQPSCGTPSFAVTRDQLAALGLTSTGQAVAVAFSPSVGAQFVALLREPAALLIVDDFVLGSLRVVPLGGSTRLDTGHDIFHRAAGAGMACASCHPEGGDDGHTWLFSGLGARRTQSLNTRLGETAPFHWDGTLPGVDQLMDEVFVHRMGGVFQSPGRLQALQDWLFSLKPPMAIRSTDDPQVTEGRAIFESQAAGCTTCHSGPALTNNQNAYVGTGRVGEQLQVPSLLGVAYRTPLMHDGCAQTLRERFDPACGGGELHGNTAQLSETQIDALVAYLESL